MATYSSSLAWKILRESVPRQVDESRGPQGERGLEFSRRNKGQTFFFFQKKKKLVSTLMDDFEEFKT